MPHLVQSTPRLTVKVIRIGVRLATNVIQGQLKWCSLLYNCKVCFCHAVQQKVSVRCQTRELVKRSERTRKGNTRRRQ